MELFVQLFFVGQDGKDTSNIFNNGFYHKDDFRNMLLSYSGDYTPEITPTEIKEIKEKTKDLNIRRNEKLKLSDFYKITALATEYLSRIKHLKSVLKKCIL